MGRLEDELNILNIRESQFHRFPWSAAITDLLAQTKVVNNILTQATATIDTTPAIAKPKRKPLNDPRQRNRNRGIL